MRMSLNLLRLRNYSYLYKRFITSIAASMYLAVATSATAGEPTFTPSLGTELRYFPEDAAHAGQMNGVQSSLIVSGEGRWVSDDRKQRIRFEPFLRLDARDNERTHWDIRELSYSKRTADFDIFAGAGQIFWGVAESRNVVDVINQFDVVENSDETDKLGQPMLRIGKFFDVGRIEAYYLPYFRERTFSGIDGRQRGPIPFDTDDALYERNGGQWAGDFALRYTTQFDAFDIGAHVFYGTNRNPVFTLRSGELVPLYQELAQSGIDVQWTQDEWLLKFEIMGARSGNDDYIALVGGYEYTFFDIAQSGIDIGVLTEYLYDSRDETKTALSLFENDVFIGSRLTLNDMQDTELLGGAIIDIETGAAFGSIEFERRIGDNYLLEAEMQYLTSPSDNPINDFDSDSNLILRLTRYF